MGTNKLLFGLAVAGAVVGCQSSASGPGARGATMREYAGPISVVFTNATPAKMCNLQMSFEDADKFGDNWLPAAGLPTGESIKFKVEPGKYKATWNTCKDGDKPYFAATLTGEMAVDIKDDAQLFAYIADTVAPTKRAAPVEFHAMVKFQGQVIDPNPGRTKPVEPETQPAEEMVAKEAPKARAKPTFDASYIDSPKAKAKAGKKKPAVKPSLARDHDLTRQAVRMKAR